MRFLAIIYTLTVGIIALAHFYGWSRALGAMIALHFSLLGIFAIKALIEISGKTNYRKMALGSFSAAVLAWGIAFKLAWLPYANIILMTGIALLISALAVTLYHRKTKPVFRNLATLGIPLGMAASMTLMIGYPTIFNYANQQHVAWNPNERIDWNSFHGLAEPDSHFDATIYSVIHYNYRWEFNDFHYVAEAYFDPNLSWHSEGTPHLLEHERLHFDLTAIYAAKLRTYFEEVKATPNLDRLTVKQHIDQILREWDLMQEIYDIQTNHGTIFREQMNWQRNIDTLLLHYNLLPAPLTRTKEPARIYMDTLFRDELLGL